MKITALPVCLASASSQRLALVQQIGVTPVQVIPQSIDETQHKAEYPRVYVSRMARTKAARALQVIPDPDRVIILAADTVVVRGKTILGKPDGRDQVSAHLELLSGRSHRVYTAVVVFHKRWSERIVMTRVTFKRLARWEINEAILCEEGNDTAGGYAIQGRGGGWVRKLSGSYSNVAGLPLYETRQLLIGCGWSPDL